MKKIFYIKGLIFIGLSLSISCKKTLNVQTPTFDVSTTSQTYKVGQVVNFNLTGNPDFISFYSGQIGNDYAYKTDRIIPKGKVQLSFNSGVQYGTQANMFSVLASTDFNGNYSDISNVKAATWMDITNKFLFATTTAYVNSGQVDISDVVQDGKPLYIAFKLTVRDADLYGVWRVWRVQAYQLTTQTTIGTSTLADMNTSGFMIVDKDPSGPDKTRSSVTTATISLYPAAVTDANKNINTETWAISNSINAGKIDAGPDRPITVKGPISGQVNQFQYTYTTPGNYTVYFIASNTNIDGTQEIVKKIDLTITP